MLEKTLQSPLDGKEIKWSVLKKINPEYSLEGLILKLKLQCFGASGHLMRRADSLEKTLMLVKIESRRRRGQQRMRLLDGITDSMDMSLSKFWEVLTEREAWCCSPWGRKELEMTERLNQTDRILSSVGFQHMLENQYLGVIGEFYSKISNTESL